MALNKVMLIGNVGKDPDIITKGDKKVAKFTIATSEKYTDRNGESRENTEWHNVVAFGNNADVTDKYIRKGDRIFVEGKLRTNEWTDQNGEKRKTTEVNVDRIELLSTRGGNANSSEGPSRRQEDDNEF